MNKKIITLIALLIIVISAIASVSIERKNYLNLDITSGVKKIVKNTEFIDINTDHNQVIDVFEKLKNKKIKIPSILINFDTHSDIMINTKVFDYTESNVGNWINYIVTTYPEVNEIYWVMPTEVANNVSLQRLFAINDLEDLKTSPLVLFGNSMNPSISSTHFMFNPLTKKSFEQELLTDPTTGKINENTNNEELFNKLFDKDKSQLRKIKLITCTEKTLPDFKNKDIFLSIDADYTSNSGFDTSYDFTFINSKAGINAKFYSIFDNLNKKNAKPRIITLSLSPQYLPEIHHEYVNDIFEYILELSNKNDEIKEYKNKYIPPDLFMLKYKKSQ